MATRKVKDDKGREYEIDVDDDDDDDDDDGPFIDESELKGLFEKWLGEREKGSQKRKGVRIKSNQQTPPKSDNKRRTHQLRIA